MTEQELIDALNVTEAERVRWMTVALTAGNEIAALKAQVNCLRGALKILDRNSKAREALEATPEQCLAEVKVKAIEEMIAEFNKTRFLGTSLTKLVSDYVTQLREQAK